MSELILRDLLIGITRFDALHAHLGVSRKILTRRLSRLVNDEIVVRRAHTQRPEGFDYILTGKGWQRRCDHLTTAEIRCSHCGEPLHAADTQVTPLR